MSYNLGGYTLYGDQGCMRASAAGYEVFPANAASDAPVRQQPYPVQRLSDYAQEIEAFADYVLHGRPGPTTGRSERRSLAIVEAGYESMRTGQPVHLGQRFGPLT
jgi:predicted dehydrogenase